MKAAEFEEKAAMQERRAAIGLRMPQINVTGAYAYLGKDIGFDFNEMKGPAKNLAGQLLGSGLIPPEAIPSINGLLNPLLNADWFLTLQDRSLGFVGGGKINAANRAARINERTAAEQGNQTRNALISELVERYFGLALAMQVVEVRRQVVDGVRRHLEDAIALEKNGMIAQSERLYVEFKMAEAERELANAKLQAETIASALSNTLGRENAWQPVTSMFMIDKVEDLAYYQDLAQDRNPLLNQVSLKRQLAEEGKQTARRVGALQNKAGKDISVLVEKLYNQMMNYRNQMTSIDASLNFAEEYLRMKNAAFLEGMSSSSDLIDAELNLAGVRTERLQAAYNFDLLLAQLLETAGISDEFPAYARRSDARPVLFDKK